MAKNIKNHRRMVKKIVFRIETMLCYCICILVSFTLIQSWVDITYRNYLLPNTGYSMINILLMCLHAIVLVINISSGFLFGYLAKVGFEDFNSYVGLTGRKVHHHE